METSDIAPSTPITSRADRTDERVRLIEEAVLLIRGEWPAVASGLCESVNRAAGLIFRSGDSRSSVLPSSSRPKAQPRPTKTC